MQLNSMHACPPTIVAPESGFHTLEVVHKLTNNRVRGRLKLIVSGGALLITLSPNNVAGQTGVEQFNGVDMKHYAMTPIPGRYNRFMMAGTMFNCTNPIPGSSSHAVHWKTTNGYVGFDLPFSDTHPSKQGPSGS